MKLIIKQHHGDICSLPLFGMCEMHFAIISQAKPFLMYNRPFRKRLVPADSVMIHKYMRFINLRVIQLTFCLSYSKWTKTKQIFFTSTEASW